jgi:dTDP-4-amino-4,6-dideoxygalactose transaminase
MKEFKTLKCPADLAEFGAAPLFNTPLFIGRPNLGDRTRLMERIDGILARRWLTNNGQVVQELGKTIENYLGVKHAILTCNGTMALELAIRALDLRGEVILPSFTFVATAHVLQWLGIRPVFADIDPISHQLDPAAVERAITPHTSGIIGVHLWGKPCPIDALSDLARTHRLRLLFDAAHAFSCSYQNRMIGTFGDCEVFSFHATKFFNTSEGGAVCTNNDELASKLRLMKNFGFRGYDDVVDLGINGKMTEICAAMGLTNWESLGSFIETNRRNFDIYRQELESVPGIRLFEFDKNEACNYQYVILEIFEKEFGLSRDQLCRILHAENVIARRYFFPGAHRMEPYRTLYPAASQGLRETENVAQRVLSLPTGTQVGAEDIKAVCRSIQFVNRRAQEIRERIDRTG